MARKTPKMTDKKIDRYLKEGRGQGEGAEYTPWLKVGDFSSHGRGHRIKDPKTGREHHFFSDLEADFFWHLIWNDKIVDIPLSGVLLQRQWNVSKHRNDLFYKKSSPSLSHRSNNYTHGTAKRQSHGYFYAVRKQTA